jgi:hypothetical protein
LGTLCFDPPPHKWRKKTNKQTKKKACMKSGLCTVQVESEQSTLHTKHKLEKKLPLPHKRKREVPSLDDTTSHHWHGNSIPQIAYHYFWHGLIALRKNNLPIEHCTLLNARYCIDRKLVSNWNQGLYQCIVFNN